MAQRCGNRGVRPDPTEPGDRTILEILPEGRVVEDEATLECTFTVAYPARGGDSLTCTFTNIEKGLVDVLKLNDGVIDPTADFTFALYDGPNGNAPDSTLLEKPLATGSTLGTVGADNNNMPCP